VDRPECTVIKEMKGEKGEQRGVGLIQKKRTKERRL
jgi:hypothetical protein